VAFIKLKALVPKHDFTMYGRSFRLYGVDVAIKTDASDKFIAL
jgi:hypothetical protein